MSSIVKNITGNLVSENEEKYNKLVEDLKSNRKSIQENLEYNYNYKIVKQILP